MRDYSQFRSSFWTGETGKKLRQDPDAQRLASYLITSPHSNAIGFYWIPMAYVSMETGIPLEGACKALERLSAMGFAHYDADAEVVWVVNMAREQLGLEEGGALDPKDNRGKSARKAADLVRRSALYPAFHEKYSEAFGLAPLQAPYKPLSTASEDQEQEQEQERRGFAPDAPTGAPVTASPAKEPRAPSKADEAKAALRGALKASFRATGDLAPEVADGTAAKAARRLREFVESGHAPDLATAATRLVDACRRQTAERWPWCLLSVNPTKPAPGLAAVPAGELASLEAKRDDLRRELRTYQSGPLFSASEQKRVEREISRIEKQLEGAQPVRMVERGGR
jgi:hypothetical protein